MKSKLIEYAYASSPAAIKAGHGLTGCWFIKLYPDGNTLMGGKQIGDFFPIKSDAVDYADSLPNPYHSAHNKYFNL